MFYQKVRCMQSLNTWIRVCCLSNRLSQHCRKVCNLLTFFSSEDPFSGPCLQPVPGHCWRGVEFSGLGVGSWISVLGVPVISVQHCLLESLHFVKSWSCGCVANRSWDEGATSQLSSGAWKHSIYGRSAKYWYKSLQSTLINHNSSWLLSPNLLDMQQDGERWRNPSGLLVAWTPHSASTMGNYVVHAWAHIQLTHWRWYLLPTSWILCGLQSSEF